MPPNFLSLQKVSLPLLAAACGADDVFAATPIVRHMSSRRSILVVKVFLPFLVTTRILRLGMGFPCRVVVFDSVLRCLFIPPGCHRPLGWGSGALRRPSQSMNWLTEPLEPMIWTNSPRVKYLPHCHVAPPWPFPQRHFWPRPETLKWNWK